MDHLQRSLRAKGYSGRVASAISRAHRQSTRSLYDDKWLSFENFCKDAGRDPLSVDPQFVANFLLHLRQKRHLKGGTISTYLSALNSVLAVKSDRKFSKVPELVALLKSFKLEDQKLKFRPPAWDLNVVLRYLRGAPFEPLSEASFQDLSRKTAFLLSFATAARVSELHALDVTRVRFEQSRKGSVHLGLLWNFVAKNQLPGQPGRTFTIPPLSKIVSSSDAEELALCPVRALREYIDRSAPKRGTRKRLFIPFSPSAKGEVTRNTLSLWLRTVILAAYDAAGLPHPVASNPHEIRALASTMALHRNCSVPAIMEGCFWRSTTVFASHYLRDLAVEDVQGLQTFGPLVVAQQLAAPTSL